MDARKLAGLVEALGGVDWASLSSGPAVTLEDVAEALLPCFDPLGLVAADGIALFVALAALGVVRPDPNPIADAQTSASPDRGGPACVQCG